MKVLQSKGDGAEGLEAEEGLMQESIFVFLSVGLVSIILWLSGVC